MQKKDFGCTASELVKDMEDEIHQTRKHIKNIKDMKGLNEVSPEMKQELVMLFKIASGKYTFRK